ncbi:MAG: hypothetical protein LBV71_16960 [Prevotella sp.]|jgi:hypothetical protein|nr:hypothetical protein [Prevotella sp.]
MKQIFCILVIAMLFPACSSTFFYSTLNTPNEYVEKVDNGDFLLETDSLWIAYCFKGGGGPVQITVFNKSDKPLYVDWKRSALIIDNVAMTYAGEKIDYSGDWDTFYSNQTYSWGGFDSQAVLPKGVSFVPPQTMISETPLSLNPNFEHINNKSYRDSRIGNTQNIAVKVKRLDFEQGNSPLAFKSYLTVYFQSDRPLVYEQDFYLETLLKTNAIKPLELAGGMAERGDFFYVEKPANNTALYTTLGIVAGAGLIVVGVAYGDTDTVDYDDDYW